MGIFERNYPRKGEDEFANYSLCTTSEKLRSEEKPQRVPREK